MLYYWIYFRAVARRHDHQDMTGCREGIKPSPRAADDWARPRRELTGRNDDLLAPGCRRATSEIIGVMYRASVDCSTSSCSRAQLYDQQNYIIDVHGSPCRPTRPPPLLDPQVYSGVASRINAPITLGDIGIPCKISQMVRVRSLATRRFCMVHC